MNTFFSNIVSDLETTDYNNCDQLAEDIQKPVLKAIVKYKNHPSILTIGYIVCTHLPLSAGGGAEGEMLDRTQFLEGGCWKRGGDLFERGIAIFR